MALRTVIDTNILVSALSSKSQNHWLVELLLEEKLELSVTEDILLEDAEVLKTKYSDNVASNFLLALRELPNVFYSRVFFRWNLISDADDNKFIDCYVSSGAHYLITHDSHFSILKSVVFPKINVVSPEEFKASVEAK
jgi:putative PIN family toxin of toxin-antitoxin system